MSAENPPAATTRLCKAAGGSWRSTAEQIRQAVIDDLRGYVGARTVHDDVTLVVLKQK